MRKKIVIVERGEDGIAILDTPKKRILFVLMVVFCILFTILFNAYMVYLLDIYREEFI